MSGWIEDQLSYLKFTVQKPPQYKRSDPYSLIYDGAPVYSKLLLKIAIKNAVVVSLQ